ncbi:MAG: nucleotidyltransferase domain-containing protein [Deltaproteobacteria bacterium]|jgi:predicted nucleotidyltransferase|nr:nucleotidyltransferase domain-containing protein [Deltaproteobacteria bacterium]
MIYSLEQIKVIVLPIAIKYNLKALWVFGSYARGEATEESDVDILMDDPDFNIFTLLDLYQLNDELENKFNKRVDLISTDALFCLRMKYFDPKFVDIVNNEKVIVYNNL